MSVFAAVLVAWYFKWSAAKTVAALPAVTIGAHWLAGIHSFSTDRFFNLNGDVSWKLFVIATTVYAVS
jgi:hypothetical protein